MKRLTRWADDHAGGVDTAARILLAVLIGIAVISFAIAGGAFK